MAGNEDHERRKLRTKYRNLISSIADNRPALINESPLLLKEKIDETDVLFAKVTHCREAALDAQCVSSIANLGKQKIQALSTGFDNFSIPEFCQKLITRLNPTTADEDVKPSQCMTPENWVRLGIACQTFFKRTPTLHFMYGSFEKDDIKPAPADSQKQKNIKTRESKGLPPESQTADVPKVRETGTVFGEDKDKDEQTTIAVEQVHNILKRIYERNNRQPICFFEFVVNPESFAQTVENVFHTSFLVKDGFVRIFLDADDLPVIEPVEGDIVAANDSNTSNQMVMAWTMEGWREIRDTFQITKPLIPTRPPKK